MTSYTKASLVLLAVFFVSCACATPSGRNGKKWVLLAAGSATWSNYRHQSDVCHAYQIARSHGIPQENIITMMYDDIAYNRMNPYPGQIFNSPAMVDNYRGVVKDYTGEDVTPQNFINVLMGNKRAMQGIGSGKVVDSGPNDEIFVYFTDHGNKGLIGFPHGVLYATTLINALKQMASSNRFNKMVFYMEACFSGTMFQQLPRNINVFATSAANFDESSYCVFCGDDSKVGGTCMADEYSWNWMNEIDSADVNRLTLNEQFAYVQSETKRSHPMKFGSASMGTLTLSNFLGGNSYGAESNMTVRQTLDHQQKAVPSHEAVFHYLRHQLKKAEGDKYEEFGAALQLHREIEALARTRMVVEEIVETVALTEERRREILEGNRPLTLEIQARYESAADAFLESGSFTDTEKGHALQHMQILVNLCSADWTTQEEIIDAIKSACRKAMLSEPLPLPMLLSEEEECWMGDAVCEAMCHARSVLGYGGLAGGCEDGVCKCV